MAIPEDLHGEDIYQWLRGTWFLYNDAPVQYRGSEGTVLHFTTMDGHREACRAYDAALWWPAVGAVNIEGEGALYVQRRGARQWRRSYSSRELSVMVPEAPSSRLQDRLRNRDSDDSKVVDALFKANYFTLDQAEQILRRRPSAAISRQLILSRSDDSKVVHRVYYQGRYAGTWSRGGGLKCSIGKRYAKRINSIMGGAK